MHLPTFEGSQVLLSDSISAGQEQVCRAPCVLIRILPCALPALINPLTAVPTQDMDSRELPDVLFGLIQNKLYQSLKMLVPVPICHWRGHTFCLSLLNFCLMTGYPGMGTNNSPFYT